MTDNVAGLHNIVGSSATASFVHTSDTRRVSFYLFAAYFGLCQFQSVTYYAERLRPASNTGTGGTQCADPAQ